MIPLCSRWQLRGAVPLCSPDNKVPLQGSISDKRKADSLCLKAQAASLLLSAEQRYIKPRRSGTVKKFLQAFLNGSDLHPDLLLLMKGL